MIAAREYREGQEVRLDHAREAERTRVEQAKQSELTRLDQARPYLSLVAEPSPVSRHFVDLVLRNSGAGPARNVRIRVDPPLRAAADVEGHLTKDARIFTEPVPMLPPGFSLSTFFDSALARNDQEDLPSTYNVRITYDDGHGHSWDETSILDIELQRGLTYTEEYGIHHIGEALREIEKLLKTANQHLKNPIDVTVEQRQTHIERVRSERAESFRKHEELSERMLRRQRDAEDGGGKADDGEG